MDQSPASKSSDLDDEDVYSMLSRLVLEQPEERKAFRNRFRQLDKKLRQVPETIRNKKNEFANATREKLHQIHQARIDLDELKKANATYAENLLLLDAEMKTDQDRCFAVLQEIKENDPQPLRKKCYSAEQEGLAVMQELIQATQKKPLVHVSSRFSGEPTLTDRSSQVIMYSANPSVNMRAVRVSELLSSPSTTDPFDALPSIPGETYVDEEMPTYQSTPTTSIQDGSNGLDNSVENTSVGSLTRRFSLKKLFNDTNEVDVKTDSLD